MSSLERSGLAVRAQRAVADDARVRCPRRLEVRTAGSAPRSSDRAPRALRTVRTWLTDRFEHGQDGVERRIEDRFIVCRGRCRTPIALFPHRSPTWGGKPGGSGFRQARWEGRSLGLAGAWEGRGGRRRRDRARRGGRRGGGRWLDRDLGSPDRALGVAEELLPAIPFDKDVARVEPCLHVGWTLLNECERDRRGSKGRPERGQEEPEREPPRGTGPRVQRPEAKAQKRPAGPEHREALSQILREPGPCRVGCGRFHGGEGGLAPIRGDLVLRGGRLRHAELSLRRKLRAQIAWVGEARYLAPPRNRFFSR